MARREASPNWKMMNDRPLETKDFDIVVKSIGNEWIRLALKILPRAEVQVIEDDHKQYGVKQMMYEALLTWQQQTKEELTVNSLITHLVEIERLDIVRKINPTALKPEMAHPVMDLPDSQLVKGINTDRIRPPSAPMLPPATQNSKLLCCGQMQTKTKNVFATYDVKLNQWSTKTISFEAHSGMPMVWFKDNVYIFGNHDYTSPSAKVIKYNPTTNTHVCEEKLLTPVSYAGAGVLNESIIVVNGLDKEEKPVTTVQCYNPDTRDCRTIASTNHGHSQPHVLTYSNHLYCLGCFTSSNSVECYDAEADQWTVITAIPGTIYGSSATIFAGRLWVHPLFNANVFQVYDFLSDTWMEKKMEGSPKRIWVLHSVKIDRKESLLVRTYNRTLHVYDPELDQWRQSQAWNSDISAYSSHCVINC